jgi:hypothetical protein
MKQFSTIYRSWSPWLLLLLLVLPLSARGQNSTGITGRVADQTGAVISKAAVTAHNELTNQDLKTISTSTGDFTFTNLRPGLYDISATAPGFGTTTETAIHLELEATVTVKLLLKPGADQESVTVVADEAQLDRTHADHGVTFSQDELENAPFNSGNPLMLANAEPGVIFTGSVSAGWVRPFDNGAINQFSANGQVANSNDFQLDGSPDNANSFGSRDIGYVPPTASIQEMKFITNPYDAQYGHSGGGIFDIVTKYGTNTFHGQIYENARRTWLDANSHYNNNPVINLAKASDTRDQFGFEADGPLLIPHFYNGRDKTFFELQMEKYKQNTPQSGIDSVPALSPGSTTETVAQTGDFSGDFYWDNTAQANEPTVICDPATADSNGFRANFANNSIATRMNPTAQKILSYLPKPNRATPSGQNYGMENYVWQKVETENFYNVVARVDRNFGENNRTYLRYAWNKYIQQAGDFNGIPGAAGTGVFPLVRYNHFFTADWQHTFSPNALFDAHLSVTRYYYGQNQGPTPFNLSNINTDWGSYGSQVTEQVFPAVDMNTYTTFGNWAKNGGNKLTVTNTIAAMPMLTYVRGAHTMKLGLDYRWMHSSNFTANASSGYFYVDSEWTEWNAYWWNSLNNGDSVASFLLGYANNGSASYLNEEPKRYYSYPYFAPFFQDDWKLSRKLTVNLGVRWDFQMPPSESNNKIVSDFDTTAVNPVQTDAAANLPAGVELLGGNTFAGVNGKPRTIFDLDKLAIQPRLGFAYSLNDKTVIRGGIGTSYESISGQGYSQGFSQQTTYSASTDGGLTQNGNTISNPFPTIAKPSGSSLGLATYLGDSFSVSNRDFKLPGVLNYSLGVERQVGTHTTVDASYVGSRGFSLDSSDNINRISRGYAAGCNLRMGATPATYSQCITTAANNYHVANPFKGLSAFSTALTGNGNGYYDDTYLASSIYTRPFPEFGDITQTEQNDGETRYDSLQLVVSHRWHDALTAHGSYVWSKTIDSGAWNDTTYRIRQHFIDTGNRKWRYTANVDWHIPVGRGRTYLGNSGRLLDAVVGSWTMGAIYYYEAGTPAGVPSTLDVVHKQHYGVHRTYENGVHLIRAATNCVGWYNPSDNYALEAEPNGNTTNCTAGNYDFIVRPQFAANYNVSDPGVYNPNGQNLDLSMSKSFQVWNRSKVEIRFEGYNVMNHPSWQGHGYWWDPTDPHFGTINMIYDSQTNRQREVQLSGKVTW